jgi:seryl-tRNA synthetase
MKPVDTVVEKLGLSDEKGPDKEKLEEKLRSAISKQKDQEKDSVEVDTSVDKVMQEIEAIQSQSKHLGKQEEQMKGEGSDQLYNMIVFNLIANAATALMIIYEFFIKSGAGA